jgi:hypothetical protein
MFGFSDIASGVIFALANRSGYQLAHINCNKNKRISLFISTSFPTQHSPPI